MKKFLRGIPLVLGVVAINIGIQITSTGGDFWRLSIAIGVVLLVLYNQSIVHDSELEDADTVPGGLSSDEEV